MMIRIKCVIAGVILFVTSLVWSCLLVGADADKRAEKMFENYQQKKEKQE